ncbi:MAG: hypothetical protein ABIR66_10355 [Saprospiraceae bacterium]
MDFLPAYSPSTVYGHFQEIDPQSYNTIIRFFNEHAEEIKALDFEDYFEVLNAYVYSLFEVGAYQKHAMMADVVIEATIINNLKVYHGIDLYEKTLFQKSASLYHLQLFEESAYILSELIKINPSENTYRDFLIKNKLQNKPKYLVRSQGISIVLYFVSIFIIAISAFYFDPFLPSWSVRAEYWRNTSFLCGTAFLVGSEALHRFKAWWLAYDLVEKSKEKLRIS